MSRRVLVTVVVTLAAVAALGAVLGTALLLGRPDPARWAPFTVFAQPSSHPMPSPDRPRAEPTDTRPGPETRPAEIDQVRRLGIALQSNLNYKNVDGLLQFVCEDGHRGGAARADLLRHWPALDPAHPEHRVKVHFAEGRVTPAEPDGYHVLFTGTGGGSTVRLVFTVHVDGGTARWCGVAAGS
ncbi:hypothetical protein SAMN05421810_102269 [Amycolatopsis arida]|uniref:Uncharacterized protein n=1 Tax=Amycolatopsis arida TaxID=587909 RepID=A0A1I5PGL4_9PSEU|nr:hypothetical protein [Amycolatopsis arida]TDX98477.1 hypothetical protein CLV69_101269 [Amycolatopsis arida]SFP32691.1 hypothetical protein SAMN05421810_102269 [Amycolatopsis arida]